MGPRPASDYSAYLPAVHACWLGEEPDQTWREVDGTLVFADVSGFTPLTERLATLGKVGAEELTATLNGVFTRLVDEAESYGGDLLKFGGDALLLLFTGEGHEVRGCAAAVALQHGLRPFRRLRTAAGTVSLRMSVGVSSGRVQLFLVGESHRELLAAGPVTSRVAELEAAAGPGEILLSAATCGRIPAALLGDDRAGARLLRAAPRVESTPLRRPSPGPHTTAGIPVTLREHLRGERDDGEHRVAVLTFLEFRGTDDLMASRGPAAVAAALDELVRSVQQVCEEHGVCFLASDLGRNGGKILLAAGAPVASTDDEDRTLHALLHVVPVGGPLSLRAGVNRGRAFAVDVGPPQRRSYAVMGDATNLAARVMGRADPGSVVATAAVLDRVKAQFELEPLPPFVVKGKAALVHAAVVRAAGDGPRRASGTTPIVGRERELAFLRAAVDRAWTGDGRVVELVGEPGIGKSRLVAELVSAGAESMELLTIDGAPYAVHSPYFALRAPLRRLVGADAGAPTRDAEAALRAAVSRRAPHLVPWLPLLGLPFGVELPDSTQTAEIDPSFRAARLTSLFADLLNHLRPAPTLLVVEDAHWLDAATTALLDHVLADVANRPWLVCVTRRSGAEGFHAREDRNTTTLHLEPLGAEGARALLQPAQEERPLPARTIDALVERSGGNPLFLQELWAAAGAGGTSGDLPDTVEALIASRIDTLSPPDRALLRRAAVLGNRFPSSLLAALWDGDGDSLDLALHRLASFVTDQGDGVLQFGHALLREVAYETLPFRQRRYLHARIGRLLVDREQDDLEQSADLLSLHFAAAERFAEAWRFSCMAGDRARRQSSPADAAVFYERALEAASRLRGVARPDVAAVCEALGDVCEVTGQYEKAAAAYARARRLAVTDPLRTVELYRKEGWLRERSARYSEALRWYTRGLRALDRLPGSVATARARAALTLGYGVARLRQGRYRECVPYLEDAAREAEAVGDLRTLGHAYDMLYWAHTDMRSDEALRYRERALPLFEQLGDLARQASVHNQLGIGAYYAGRWDEALFSYERARDAWERAGDVVQMATAANNIAEVLSDQGRLDEAEALLREALVVWRAARFPVGIALATSNLGRLAARHADFDRAASRLAEARELFREIGAESYVLETDGREAERLLAVGEADAGLALAERTASKAAKLGATTLLSSLERLAGCALAQMGDREAAVGRLRVALDRAGDDLFAAAQALDALARLGGSRFSGGGPVDASEAGELFALLGVVAPPAVDLGSGEWPGGSRDRGSTGDAVAVENFDVAPAQRNAAVVLDRPQEAVDHRLGGPRGGGRWARKEAGDVPAS